MKSKLGTGKRFSALATKLSANPKVKNPAALAAFIGRKKFGAKGMSNLSKFHSLRGKM